MRVTIVPRRVLLVLLGAIGDVTRALPLLNRMRKLYPQAHLAWAVEPPAAPLLFGHPALNEVIVYRRDQGLRSAVSFLRYIRAGRFDVVLDLQRHGKSGLVSWWSRAPVRVGFHPRNTKEGNWLFNTHYIEPVEEFSSKLLQYLRFANLMGADDGEVTFHLALSPQEEMRAAGLLADTPRPFVSLFLGSRWESRLWFADSTAAVVRILVGELSLGVVLLGGPGETSFARAVQDAAGVPLTNLVGRTSVRDVMGILQKSTLAIGPDSGPMHIASAMGTPVISLWGATSPARSAPWGSEDLVVIGQAPCSPCYLRQCPIGRICMRGITPEKVMEKVKAVFTQADPSTGQCVGRSGLPADR